MIITLEPQGIFWIKLHVLLITDNLFILSSHWYANVDEVWPSIILADRCLLVKMRLTLEPHGIF